METHISLHRQKLLARAERVKDPLLRQLLTFAATDKRPLTAIETAAGYSEGTFRAFARIERQPRLSKVVDLGEALGYELVWRKK